MTSSEKPTANEISGRAACRAIFISLTLFILNQFCGFYTILGYSTKVFEEAGGNLSPIEGSIWICVVQLIASVITIYLVDRSGRKILYITSSIGAGIGLVGLGMHAIHKDSLQEYNWIPVFAVASIIFTASLGLIPLPSTISMDLLPPAVDVRDLPSPTAN